MERFVKLNSPFKESFAIIPPLEFYKEMLQITLKYQQPVMILNSEIGEPLKVICDEQKCITK